uniref:Polymerase PB2 n=1 Tax=Hubei orthoptera virus 6 TaxID=1923014 RepID=A0A1L3KKI3_9VIRU|nr:polymerase PB2 [Hubei orthoptera virus 6]
MNEEETILYLIKLYQNAGRSMNLNDIQMCEYDTIKRYTSSKKDSEPQMRIHSNMCKRFGVIMKSDSRIPKMDKETKLKGGAEIDKKGVVTCSPMAVDYWSAKGEMGDAKVVNSLLQIEEEKVRSFFSTSITAPSFYPTYSVRRAVTFDTALKGVPQCKKKALVLSSILPDFCPPEYQIPEDDDDLRKLNCMIGPLKGVRTLTNITHFAQQLLQSKTKWVPSIVSVNPETAELLYFSLSPFYHCSISIGNNTETLAVERLCHDLIVDSLRMENPKASVSMKIDGLRISHMPISEWIHNVKSSKPYTTIIKALCNAPISMETVICETSFSILSSEASPVSKMTQIDITGNAFFNWTYWEGKETVYFENSKFRGIFNKKDREVIEVRTIPISDDPAFWDTLVAIMYYSRSLITGFDKPLPYPKLGKEYPKEIFRYHKLNKDEIRNLLGMSYSGCINKDGFFVESSEYLGRIKLLKTKVQGYHFQTLTGIEVTQDLEVTAKKVVSTSSGQVEKRVTIIDPACLDEVKYSIYPMGIRSCDYLTLGLSSTPMLKCRESMITLARDPRRMADIISRGDWENRLIINTTYINPYSRFWAEARKRLSDSLHILQTHPRFHDIARALYLITFTKKSSTNQSGAIPMTYKSDRTNSIVQMLAKTGYIRISKMGLHIDNKKVISSDTGIPSNKRFCVTKMSSEKPNLIQVGNLEEMQEKGITTATMERKGRWYTYESRKRVHPDQDDVEKAIKESKVAKMAEDLYSLMG